VRTALFLLVFLLVGPWAAAAGAQPVTSEHVDVAGLKVGRAYRFALQQEFTGPPPHARWVPSRGESWPYASALALLGVLWLGGRKEWW